MSKERRQAVAGVSERRGQCRSTCQHRPAATLADDEKAGITIPALDEQGNAKLGTDGETIKVAKYPGLHCFRHFFASWCIDRKVDGGLELPAKVVQERLGHASIAMTLDVYGHLFPRGDDAAELAAGEKLLLG